MSHPIIKHKRRLLGGSLHYHAASKNPISKSPGQQGLRGLSRYQLCFSRGGKKGCSMLDHYITTLLDGKGRVWALYWVSFSPLQLKNETINEECCNRWGERKTLQSQKSVHKGKCLWANIYTVVRTKEPSCSFGKFTLFPWSLPYFRAAHFSIYADSL